MKKIISLLLSLVMVMGLAVGASAASIEVKDVIDGETYTAYKILNYTKSEDGAAYSYYLTTAEYTSIGAVLEAAGFAFTASADGTQHFVNNAKTVDVAAAAEYLGEHAAELGDALNKFVTTGADGEATFTGLTTGYYFVTSSAGSLCALNSEDDIATAVEKNTVPTIDKKEKLASGNGYVDGPIDVKYGDTVSYQVVITDGTGTNAAITMTDTMTDGIDYTTGSLKINGADVADDADTNNWKVTVSDRTITIVFSADYVSSLNTAGTITVTYDATVNANAVVDSATGNENKVELNYSKQHSEDKVYVATYDFLLKKTDGTNFLDGAGFKLYDAATDGNQITVKKDTTTGYYVNANADEEIMVDSADGVNIRGLAPGTYYLEETTVPAGYNKLASRQPVEIKTGAEGAVEVEVENKAGSALPSTGGIGTTLFYVIGGLLMVGAVVVMVTKKRIS